MDENASTGDTFLNGFNYGHPGLGADYGIDLVGMQQHPMGRGDAPGIPVGAERLGSAVRLRIPLTLFGPDDGRVNMAGVVYPPVATMDEFPNDGFYELRWTPDL